MMMHRLAIGTIARPVVCSSSVCAGLRKPQQAKYSATPSSGAKQHTKLTKQQPFRRDYEKDFNDYYGLVERRESESRVETLERVLESTTLNSSEIIVGETARDADQVNTYSDDFKIKIAGRDYPTGGHILVDERLMAPLLPEGYPGNYEKYEKLISDDQYQLCRTQTNKVIKRIEENRKGGFLKSKKCQSVIIDGPKGSGKSVVLSHVVMYARSNGWLVVYLKSGWDFVSNYYIKPSKTRKFEYYHHEGAKILFSTTLQAHEDKLSTIHMRTKFSAIPVEEAEKTKFLEERGGSNSNITLAELVKFGLASENPSEVFIVFRNELSHVTEYPVLIAVDDVNCLHGDSGFVKPMDFLKKKVTKVEGNEIPLFRQFNRPHILSMANGTMVCAINGDHSKRDLINAMGRDRFKEMRLVVSPFTFEEFETRLEHKIAISEIPALSTQTRELIYRLCDGRPKHIVRYLSTI